MITTTVCIAGSLCGKSSKPQTICATGRGESFSSCRSTIARVSSKSLFGRWTTRRNARLAGSHATLSLGWRRVCQSLSISFSGSGSVGRRFSSRWSGNFPPAENCQRCWASLVEWRTLQEFHRAILCPHPIPSLGVLDERLEVLLGLGYAQDFFDCGLSSFHFIPTVGAQRAHALLDRLLGDRRSGRAIENQRAKCFVQDQNFINAHAPLVAQLPAFFATGAFVNLRGGDFVFGEANALQIIVLQFLLGFAIGTNRADEALRHDGFDGRRDKKRFYAHVDQARK